MFIVVKKPVILGLVIVEGGHCAAPSLLRLFEMETKLFMDGVVGKLDVMKSNTLIVLTSPALSDVIVTSNHNLKSSDAEAFSI